MENPDGGQSSGGQDEGEGAGAGVRDIEQLLKYCIGDTLARAKFERLDKKMKKNAPKITIST